MKKLFSLMLTVLVVFGMSGCLEDADSFTVTIELGNGETTSYEVEFEPETELNLLELIETEVEVGYTESEYGAFIYQIDDISSMYGNYIAFYKNDEMSMVGVEAAEFEDGDTFTFMISWYDTTAQAVYEGIELFLENQVDTYVNDETLDYNVIAGLNLLGITEDYVTSEEVEAFYAEFEAATITDLFKQVLIYKTVGLEVTDFDTTDLFSIDVYGAAAYSALVEKNINGALDSYLSDLNTFYDANTPYDSGLDTGGISVIALSAMGVTKEDTLIADYLTWIQTDQLESGGIKTRDMVYGDTTYYGTENAASLSQVILAMISVDESPVGESYTIEGNNLVSRLTDFQTETGAFNWLIDAEQEDLAFSTPQAFLALVVVQTYLNGMGPVNPYLVD